MVRRLVILIVVAVTVSGCAAGRAFRRGEEAARNGDWDAAVTYLTRAVQASPDKAEYKIALERAMQTAAREHITRARSFEEKDQPDAALIEYRRALELDASNRLAAQKVADLERTIRDRLEASRPKPQIEKLREQARALSPAVEGVLRNPDIAARHAESVGIFVYKTAPGVVRCKREIAMSSLFHARLQGMEYG